MNGGKKLRSCGYTIVEVMIVLAVSGAMFLIAAQFINGKHEKATFGDGINQMASRLQDTIEQITDGQYSDVPVTCTFSGTTTTVTNGGAGQGKNPTCVFLGKILHFSEAGGWSAGDNLSHYEVFSIAGGRQAAGLPVTTLGAADPTVAAPLTKQQIVPQTLEVHKITVNGGISSFGFGFFQGQGGIDTTNGTSTIKNGTSPVNMFYVAGLAAGQGTVAATGQIESASPPTTNLTLAQSVDMCLTDGRQSADIVIGLNSNQLTVNVKRNGFATPICP